MFHFCPFIHYWWQKWQKWQKHRQNWPNNAWFAWCQKKNYVILLNSIKSFLIKLKVIFLCIPMKWEEIKTQQRIHKVCFGQQKQYFCKDTLSEWELNPILQWKSVSLVFQPLTMSPRPVQFWNVQWWHSLYVRTTYLSLFSFTKYMICPC